MYNFSTAIELFFNLFLVILTFTTLFEELFSPKTNEFDQEDGLCLISFSEFFFEKAALPFPVLLCSFPNDIIE